MRTESPLKPTSLMTGVLSPTTDGAMNSPESAQTSGSADLLPYSSKPEPTPKKIDFLKDKPSEMTRSRRIALKLMEKSWYYNPEPTDQEEDENSGDADSDSSDDEDKILDDFAEDIAYDKPCLKYGWAYFEHMALYRFQLSPDYETKEKHGVFKRLFRTIFMHGNKKFLRAEPGEDEFPTRLYPFWTPHNQLGDFGLGIGLYFSVLRIMIFAMFICGLISISNIIYFGSSEFDSTKNGVSWYTFFYEGKAQCNDIEWVPCPECECVDYLRVFGELFPGHRCANAFVSLSNNRTMNTTGGIETDPVAVPLTFENTTEAIDPVNVTLRFVLKNNCDGQKWELPAANFATVIFMTLSILALGWYLSKEEVKFDEDEQTAQDYSIQIKNPPEDSHDPEEWRKFFKENFDGAKVTVCTCAVENDLLVKSLLKRRELIREIRTIRPGKTIDDVELSKLAAQIERERTYSDHLKAKFLPGIPELYSQLVTLKSKVQGLSQLAYPVTNVFLTFETEEDQRNVLKNLSTNFRGDLANNKYMFRNNLVLDAVEPEEPSTILWQNLNARFGMRLKLQAYTFLVTIVVLIIDLVIIFYVNRWDVILGNYTISIFNAVFPIFARLMTDHFEIHQTETQQQISLYIKIVLFQWTNTVLVWFLILPFSGYLESGKSGLLYRIQYQFISEITIANGMALLDLPGQLKRHYLAPKANTQDAMNILFQGTPYDLADRYTDLTKLVLLCLFYCSLFPSAFFLCAIGLVVKYQTDKYNLLRTWKRAPALGPVISSFSRKYFFFLALAIMTISSSYFWTGFPYDNLCAKDSNVPINSTYVGDHSVTLLFPNLVDDISTADSKVLLDSISNVTVTADDKYYGFCNMNFFSPRITFPFVPAMAREGLNPDDYMNNDQIISTTYFGWSAIAVLGITFLKFIWFWYLDFKGVRGYKPVGSSQGIPFSEVESRCAYIPQVNSCVFAYPLIACKTDGIDEDLFDFKDPVRSYKYYDLTTDAMNLVAKGDENYELQGFSIVKSWNPRDD